MLKTAIYGLPLTPRGLIDQLAGASFCVSFAHRKSLGRQLDDAIRLVGHDGILLVDNGAYTHWRRGGTMDLAYIEAFEEWASDILMRCDQAIAVIPDVIGGTEEENRQLVLENQLGWDRTMPVWHMHESIEYLLWLCEAFNYVAIGTSGDYRIGKPSWIARIEEAFAAIAKWEAESEGAYIRPRIHMMRAQSMAHRFAFDSSDSCNVAINHCYYKAEGEGHVARMAARINGKIQASAGPEAEHQLKRPLLFHVEAREKEAEFWLGLEFDRVMRAVRAAEANHQPELKEAA